jgi:hypothetical protein
MPREFWKPAPNTASTVEINAKPWRLDLDWRWHERAIELDAS